MSHEILVFADGEKRMIKPAKYFKENFVLILLGLCQYNSDIKITPTIVHRDLQNNIIYFRDVLPVYSTSWDIYMSAVVGIVGLYFAWNFYSGKKGGNVVLEVNEKTPEKE